MLELRENYDLILTDRYGIELLVFSVILGKLSVKVAEIFAFFPVCFTRKPFSDHSFTIVC